MELEKIEDAMRNGAIVSVVPNPAAAPRPAAARVAQAKPAKKAAAPKPAKKAAAKAAPKPAAKPAPAKKAAKPAAAKKAPAKPNMPPAADPTVRFTDTPSTMRGKREMVLKCLKKDGMKLSELKAAVTKKFAGDPSWNSGRTLVVIRAAEGAGFITIK
jgi:hypothetical protein